MNKIKIFNRYCAGWCIPALLLFHSPSHGQKTDVKNDIIIYNDQNVASIQKDGCGVLSTNCQFFVNDLDGQPLITVMEIEYLDPIHINSGNPKGRVRFLRYSFTGYDGIAETPHPSLLNTRSKDIAQSIMKAQLIKDGQLNNLAVENFIKINGTRFTERQKAITPQIIIVK